MSADSTDSVKLPPDPVRWEKLPQTDRHGRPLWFAIVASDEPPDAAPRTLSFDERRRLAAEVFGIETQLLLGTMGERGPVTYRVADLFHEDDER